MRFHFAVASRLLLSVSLAIKFGLYWFVFAEIIKILMAAGVATRWQQWRSSQE